MRRREGAGTAGRRSSIRGWISDVPLTASMPPIVSVSWGPSFWRSATSSSRTGWPLEVKRVLGQDFQRIAHAVKVARYVEEIAREEKAEPVLALCAYLHLFLEGLEPEGTDADPQYPGAPRRRSRVDRQDGVPHRAFPCRRCRFDRDKGPLRRPSPRFGRGEKGR